MAQNAGWTDRAERQTVDAMQTNNVPIIDCSTAFASLNTGSSTAAFEALVASPPPFVQSAPRHARPTRSHPRRVRGKRSFTCTAGTRRMCRG
eukprot:5502841-Pleurochrysis_carterae.AAC.1